MSRRRRALDQYLEDRPSRGPTWHWVPCGPDLQALAVPGGHARVAIETDGWCSIAAYTQRGGHLDLGHCGDLETARGRAEAWALAHGGASLHHAKAESESGWRCQAMTEGQEAALRAQGITIPLPACSRGLASDLLVAAQARYCAWLKL